MAKKIHTKKDAEYCLWYFKKHIYANCELIGSFGKGTDQSLNDIDIYFNMNGKKPIEKYKTKFAKMLNATSVDDTDWGGWFFHNTVFGNVDVFFDITEFDY